MNRICMYTPTASGGHARYARELTTALAEAGSRRFEFDLVTSEDLDEQYWSDAYRVHPILPRLRERSAFASRAAWAASRVTHYARREACFLRWLAGQQDVAAVHFQEWTPWLAASVFRRLRRTGKKVFYTVHNVTPHRYPARVPKPLMHHWIRRACRLADGLFVHSDGLAEELRRFLGPGPVPHITVAPHGVWTVPNAESALPLQQRLSEKNLLFFGTIRRNKGLDLLLRAALRLPGYSITIAGYVLEDGYFRDEVLPLIARVRAAGVPVNLIDRFVSDEEAGQLFRTHGALVLPYTQQFAAQSGVVFMALAYELPVIASEVGGLRDLMRDHRIGTTFAEFTPAALAGAVEALHADGGSAEELLKQIRAAKDRYSWAAAARATLAGYARAESKVTESHDCRVASTTPAC